MSGRRCTFCGHTKRSDAFYRQPAWGTRRARIDSWCKACRRLDVTIRYRHRTGGGLVDAAATRALAGWLLDRGHSVVSLAEACGCTPKTVRNLLAGQRRVRRVTARRMRDLADQHQRQPA